VTGDNDPMQPLAGYRIGVTAARKVAEQVKMLERRGATVVWAPALSTNPNQVDDASLRAATDEVLDRPIDLFLATTGVGMRTWFGAAESWGMHDRLVEALGHAELLARGPKSVGALRRRGLREAWAAESEELDEMLRHLEGRDLSKSRIVVQEHGQSLSTVADALRSRGADVTTVAIYRIAPAEDPTPLHSLIASIADRQVDAVTFTSAPAVAALIRVADSIGRRDELLDSLRAPILASCVGPVTAAAFDVWDVPAVYPGRSRLAAMVRQLEVVLPSRGRPSS
jgi:uroporphyrinogen-III synthase